METKINLATNLEFLQEYILTVDNNVVKFFLNRYYAGLISWEKTLSYITITLLTQNKLLLENISEDCWDRLKTDNVFLQFTTGE